MLGCHGYRLSCDDRDWVGTESAQLRQQHQITAVVMKLPFILQFPIQWRPLIIIADNVINRLSLSKSVVPKHSI